MAPDGSYTQEQKQQSLKEQSWDERPMEVVFNGEPLRSIGMNGLFHVFNCPMPQTDDDKKASLDRYFNAYDENVNSRIARTFKKGVGYERSHRTVSTSGIPPASMPIVSVPCTSVVDDALPDELAKKLKVLLFELGFFLFILLLPFSICFPSFFYLIWFLMNCVLLSRNLTQKPMRI